MMTGEQQDELIELREEVAALRAALRSVTDSLNGLLMAGKFPERGRPGSDQEDYCNGWWEDNVSAVQRAYAALAGVTHLEWVNKHPGLVEMPFGPVKL